MEWTNSPSEEIITCMKSLFSQCRNLSTKRVKKRLKVSKKIYKERNNEESSKVKSMKEHLDTNGWRLFLEVFEIIFQDRAKLHVSNTGEETLDLALRRLTSFKLAPTWNAKMMEEVEDLNFCKMMLNMNDEDSVIVPLKLRVKQKNSGK